ncbi:MAG: thiamine pyrophosphate-binding protein [Candidatus Omnitrophica bacterium]|nr:thiamine pyrophosphate-binding protein [Candidatus Omnitrophota bacterium]
MKTSDFIAQTIRKETDTVFGVTGGCVVNLVDSFGKAGIKLISVHHEQSAAIAADAYARFKNLGVCYATSGPGVTNLITGTCCSYFDSIPVLTIGGQVPSKFLDGVDRQTGFQEVDSVRLFEPITKLSKRYSVPLDLINCINIAKTPRQGPTFLEIPDDVQRREIDYVEKPFARKKIAPNFDIDMSKFRRPLLIIGAGARDMQLEIKMPFLCTWGIKDKYYHHKYYKGDFGITGNRHGNAIIKAADLIIFLGTKLDTHHCPNWDSFAPNAYKIAIGLEFPHLVDEVINCDLNFSHTFQFDDWCERSGDNVTDADVYRWVDVVSAEATPDDIIIPDMGQIGCIVFQRWKIKQGQRLFNGINHSPMGYSIPGAIGASLATGRRVIVIIGDGSLMMNIQELQTISELNLPINIFVVNNGGYGMIRQTQNDWIKYLDQGVACNFNIPDVKKIADTFGFEYTDQLNNKPSMYELKFDNTRILPKWKQGESL